jgi:hypothetical protein
MRRLTDDDLAPSDGWAVQYPRAEHATVALRRVPDKVVVEVSDDGVGGADAARGSGSATCRTGVRPRRAPRTAQSGRGGHPGACTDSPLFKNG